MYALNDSEDENEAKVTALLDDEVSTEERVEYLKELKRTVRKPLQERRILRLEVHG